MKPFSEPVVGVAAEIACGAYSGGELRTVFITAGLARFVPAKYYSKPDLVSDTILPATKQARKGDAEVGEALTTFVTRVVARVAYRNDAETEGAPFWRLREALRSDGYDVHRELEPVEENQWPPQPPRVTGVRILPLDDPAAPFNDSITALDSDLRRLKLDVAVNCYRQAVDNLVEGHSEAANGQIRAFLEEVAVQAAMTVGYSRTKQGDGGNAIRYLIEGGHLPAKDAGQYIRGLWGMTHTNGPHPGTTTAGEARFRLQAVTTATRYLVDQFFN